MRTKDMEGMSGDAELKRQEFRRSPALPHVIAPEPPAVLSSMSTDPPNNAPREKWFRFRVREKSPAILIYRNLH